MPFGRYRDWLLEDLPRSYLAWLLTIDLREPLRSDVWEEAHRRGVDAQDGRRRHTDTDREPHIDGDHRYVPDVALVEELVGAGLKVLARRHHPDVGGNHDTMVAITAAADWLRAAVRSLAA
jgi:hypothetical protein